MEFYHSSFLSGKPGLCFGMIKVDNGEITYIDNRSGHYKPTKKNLINAVDKLCDCFSDSVKVYCQGDDDDLNIMASIFS